MSRGGEWNKLGNRYEGIWTVDVLLDVVDGIYRSVTVEPLEDPTGIEFEILLNDGRSEFHSVKRQADREWSLAALAKKRKSAGRSVLSDLFGRANANANNEVVFVSSTGANQLRNLTEQARLRGSVADLEAASPKVQKAFAELVDKLSHCDKNIAFAFLRRLRVVLVDEASLTRQAEHKLAKLLYRVDGHPVDEVVVRLTLADYVISHLSETLTKPLIVEELKKHGYQLLDWSARSGVPQRVEQQNERYCRQIDRDLINGGSIPRIETDQIVEQLLRDDGPDIVIVEGIAGVGKSCVIAQVVAKLQEMAVPHLVIRMDEASGLATTRDFGSKLLNLSKSPAVIKQPQFCRSRGAAFQEWFIRSPD